MSSFNPIEQLKREGSVALWHDYRLGHANDLSGNGNDGTLINSPWFDRNGLNTTYLGNESVQVAHSASINLTTFTVVALITTKRIFQGSSNLPQLARKHDAGGLSWSLRFDESSNLARLDGDVTSFWIPGGLDSGLGCVGFGAQSGSAATSYYANGLVRVAALGGGAPTITARAVDLFIGNYYLGSRGFGRTISSFLIFNKLLSATEHAQVYGQLMKTRQGILI